MQANTDKPKLRNSLPNPQSVLKTVGVMKDKESLRNCHSQEESKEADDKMQSGLLDGILEQKETLVGRVKSK